MKRQEMNFLRKCSRSAFVALLAAHLGACTTLQDFAGRVGGPGGFDSLSSEVAVMAEPVDPFYKGQGKDVICVIGKGAGRFGRSWADLAQTHIALPYQGQPVLVSLPARKGSQQTELEAYYDAPGQKMVFCPLVDVPSASSIPCLSLYVLEDDLQAGLKRTFDVPDAVRSAAISCAFSKDRLLKL